jgi:hypothetical protein
MNKGNNKKKGKGGNPQQKPKSQNDNNSVAAQRNELEKLMKQPKTIEYIYNEIIKKYGNDLAPSAQAEARLKKEAELIKKDIMRAVAKSNDSPLQSAGSLLTGTIAAVVHQLCDPGKAPMVAYPGENPMSLVRCNFTPFKSIPLLNGQANVITTPMGKYSVFRTADQEGAVNGVVTIEPFNQTLYREPVMVMTTASSGNIAGISSTCTVFGQGSTGTKSAWITNKFGANFWLELRDDIDAHPQSLVMNIPDSLLGSQLTVLIDNAVQNFTVNEPGISCVGLGAYNAGVNCPADIPVERYYAGAQVGGTTGLLSNLYFSDLRASNLPPHIQVSFSRFILAPAFLAPYQIPLELNNYFGYRVPQLSALSSGELNKKGGFIAASTIITSDASMIANGGFIFGASINDAPLVAPSFQSFQDWVSSRSQWFYKGQLRRGMYQVYIPEEIELEEDNDVTSSPWFSTTGNYYSMVFCIDNSFSPDGGQLPRATQAHVTWESVYSTTGAGGIIPLTSSVTDVGFNLALSILRETYNPTANEAHIDAMKDWAFNTLSTLGNYGKSIINSPVTKDLVSTMITKGVPLMLEGVSSLL